MRRIAALAFLAGFIPSLAAAQVPTTLPANTVLGRLGTGAGPVQAIPFSVLGPSLITSNLAVSSPLAITGLNLSITGVAGGVLAGASPAFTSTPTLGVASSLTGSLTLASSANSGTVTLTAPSTATSWTCKLPTTQGLSGQALITDGAAPCQLSWSAGAGTVNSGLAGQLAFYAGNSAAVSGTANFTINNSTGILTVGLASTLQGSVALSGSVSGATTLAGPTSGGGTQTFQAGSDTVVGRATTDTLTNKTLTSPTINTPTIAGGALTGLTGLAIRDTSAAFDVTVAAVSTSAALTAGRTLTLDVGNVAHTVKFGTTANTITFPNVASDTVVMLTAAQTVTTKTITGSTYEGLTISTTTGTLTIASGKTLTASNTLMLAGTDGTTITFQGTDTYVGRTTNDTLTNKTLTSPTINGGTAQALTNLGIRSTGTGAFDLVLANTENLTAQRILTLTLNNAARAINISGNITMAADFITAGANALTLTTTGTTNVTLPTSGTLATINTAQTFSSTNTFSALQQFTDAKFSSGKLYPTANSTTALQITKADATTVIANVDTTNARLGINKTTPSFDLDVSGTIGFTTLDPTSLASSTSTITGLTANNSPTAANDYVPYYSAADGKIRKITLAALVSGSVAGVANVNGLTGGLTLTSTGQANVASSGTTVTIAVPDTYSVQNCSLTASVGSNLLTVALKDNAGADPSATSPCRIPFRSSTATTGSWTIDSVTGATSISTNSTGATLGSANSTAFRFWVVAFDNSGTVVLALYNASSTTACTTIDESVVASSTAVSGSATAVATYYTPNGTTVTSKAIRILGYVEYNSTGLATAGTYASAPNFVQTFGPGIHRPCEKWYANSVATSSNTTTTSITFVDTGLTMTVTPKSAANHIACSAAGLINNNSASAASLGTITRTSTNIGSISAFSGVSGNATMIMLAPFDSPNTTSGTTYKVQVRNTDGAATLIFPNSFQAELSCDEVMG